MECEFMGERTPRSRRQGPEISARKIYQTGWTGGKNQVRFQKEKT
jgi:hypothetical protein